MRRADGPPEAQDDSARIAGGSDKPGVSVVIVTYRNAGTITECLRAVAAVAARTSVEVIVVDNNSPDNTVEVVRTGTVSVRLVERSENSGFAAGCAAGADVATGPWLLFLNPDTSIAADAVDALLQCADGQPDVGIVGGRFTAEGYGGDAGSWWGKPTVWSSACFALGLNTIFAGSRFFDPEAPRPWSSAPGGTRTVPVISGGFMLVRRDLWDRLGGFDRSYFMYGEDVDLCLRAAKAGSRAVVSASALCQHAGGKSSTSADKLVLLFTGKATLIRRHFRPGLRALGIALLQAGVLLRATASKRLSLTSPSKGKRPTTSGEDWELLWAARSRWRRGWTGTATPPGSRT